jgi:hypothetical protein
MVVVIGAGGTTEYREAFLGWADQWKSAAKASNIECVEIGRNAEKIDREQLQSLIMTSISPAETPLWLVFVGHGTFDRNTAKFNLRGPDVASSELKEWLSDCQRPLIVVNGFSCSGAFLKDLHGSQRVIITATSSGAELNYSRFGGFLADSLNDKEADLDHDEQVSLLEAYLLASSKVARFYESESRLATEHSLLEDNDDGKGTPSDFFVGIRADAKAKSGAAPDGRLAHRYILVPSKHAPKLTAEQMIERDRLEAAVETLRDRKSALAEDDYYIQLEKVLVRLAKLYEDG